MADGKTSYIIDISAPTGQAQDSISALQDKLKGLANEVKRGNIGKTFADRMSAVGQALHDLDDASDTARYAIDGLEAKLKDPSATDEEKKKISALIGVYKDLMVSIDGTASELSSYEDKLKKGAETAYTSTKRLKEMREELSRMREAGQQNTEAYRKLNEEYASLKKTAEAAKKGTNGLQSTVSGVASGLTGLSGAMSAAAGMSGLFADKNEELQQIMLKVQSLMSVTMGLQAAANTLNKQSAFQQNIVNKLKERYNALTAEGSVVTATWTAMQKAHNAAIAAGEGRVAAFSAAVRALGKAILALPGVGWILAIAAAVGTLTAAIIKRNSATREMIATQERENKILSTYNNIVEKKMQLLSDKRNSTINEKQRELDLLKAQNASLERQQKLEEDILNLKLKLARERASTANIEDNSGLDDYLKYSERELDRLYRKKEEIAGLPADEKKVRYNGKKIKKDKAEGLVDEEIANIEAVRSRVFSIQKEVADAEQAVTELHAQQAKKRKEISDREFAAYNNTESMRIAAMNDGYAKSVAGLKEQARQQRNQLLLDSADMEKTPKEREEAAKQVKLVDAKLYQDLKSLRLQYEKDVLAMRRENEDIALSLLDEGEAKQREALIRSYDRQLEDLQNMIKAETDAKKKAVLEERQALLEAQKSRDVEQFDREADQRRIQAAKELAEKRKELAIEGSREAYQYEMQLLNLQMEEEIAENKAKAKEIQENEADIRKRYDAKRLKAVNTQAVREAKERLRLSQANRQAELETWEQSERAKNILALELQAEQLEETLRLHEQYNTEMTDADVQETRNALAQVRSELKKAKEQTSLWDIIEDALGISLNDNIKGKITTAFNYLKSAAKSVTKDLAELGAISETTSKNLEYAVTTIENVVAGASTGASAGGWIGAIVGAVVGLGTSVLDIFTKEKQLERAAAEQAKKDVEDLKGRIKDLKKEFADIDIFGTKNMDWSKFEDEFGKAAKYYEAIRATKAKMAAAAASSDHRTNIQGSSSLNSDMPLDFYEQEIMMLEEELVESANKAAEAISGLFNGIGSDILDMLNDTSKGAEELLADFTDSLGSYVRQWVSQMMFFELIKPELDRLESELKDSLKQAISTGDMSVFTDKLTETSNELAGLAKGWVNIRDLVTEKMQPFYDQFGGSPASGSASGMTGAVSGMSAETASLLAGQLTAMRLNAANIDSAMQQTLYHVSNIHTNTDRMAADIAEIKNGIKYNQRTNAY